MNQHVSSTLKRLTFGLTIALALAVIPIYGLKIARKRDYSDFDVYYKASERMGRGDWNHVYDLKTDGSNPFRYAPLTLPLFKPLVMLPHRESRVVWFAFQYLCYGFGFFFLFRAVRRVNREAAWITCAALLFVLRFCLDSFTIGQVSGLMFLGFAVALDSWLSRRGRLTGVFLLLPVALKLAPGMLFALFSTSRGPVRRRMLAWTGGTIAAVLVAGAALWEGALLNPAIWREWVATVVKDSVYFDASHYGSQSIRSAFLRLAKQGWIPPSQAGISAGWVCVLISTAILALWACRRPLTSRARGLFFSLGILAYLWSLPETFKYSMPFLAFPVSFLLAGKLDTWDRATLGLATLTLSLAGLDLVGKTVFFGLQKASVPLLATLALGASVTRHALRESRPSGWLRRLRGSFSHIGNWERFPRTEPSLRLSALIPLPLDRQVVLDGPRLQHTLDGLLRHLRASYPGAFELLVVPYGDLVHDAHPIARLAKDRLTGAPECRFLPAARPSGRGAAIRAGFLESSGEWILAINPEVPCDSEFFGRAAARLADGIHLVRASRRHPDSEFVFPLAVLPSVYRRFRLAKFLNGIIRRLLPVWSMDTHSGNWILTRPLALRGFAAQTFSDMFFGTELSVVVNSQEFRECDLPGVFFLENEKSRPRILRESFLIAVHLTRLIWRHRKGFYGPVRLSPEITADDWGLSPAINEGILQLARMGVVRRVSLMANSDHVENGLAELRGLPGIELGLHLNLTHGFSLAAGQAIPSLIRSDGNGRFHSPARLLFLWVFRSRGARKRMHEEIRHSLELQLQRLRLLGVRPHYLDGHHHIHLLPGLLNEISDVLKGAGIGRVRLPYDPALWLTPKFPIVVLALLARASLRRNGFEYRPCLYPRMKHFVDHGRFRTALSRTPGSEVIVHPATFNDFLKWNVADTYSAGRVSEFEALRMLGVELPSAVRWNTT